MSARPINIKISAENRLQIEWDDGVVHEYGFRELRDICPCATCREKRRDDNPQQDLLPVLSAAEAQPLRILEMQPVGNYAYTIRFSDGHDTGIYQFDLLREIGQVLGN